MTCKATWRARRERQKRDGAETSTEGARGEGVECASTRRTKRRIPSRVNDQEVGGGGPGVTGDISKEEEKEGSRRGALVGKKLLP